MYNILLIGDSLTEWGNGENGWAGYLTKWYSNKANVINKGFAGYNSKMIVDIMPTITFNIPNLILCTILLGTNDCYNINGLAPIDEYKKNITSIINHIHNLNPNIIIFLITPPVSKINNNIMFYAKSLKQIYTHQTNVVLIDLHTDNSITVNDLCDAVHFNENANNKLFEKIKNTINNEYSFLSPNKL